MPIDMQDKMTQVLDRAERHEKRMRQEAAQVMAARPMLDAIVTEISDGTIRHHPDHGWQMRDPRPFH